MTDSINVNLNNLTDEERDKLLALVEKSTNVNKNEEFPNSYEKYYYIDSSGSVISDYFLFYPIDRGRRDVDNCFRTRKEAEFEVERRKVLRKMRKIAGNIKIKSEIIFPNTSSAQRAIEEIGTSTLKKYCFRITERKRDFIERCFYKYCQERRKR